MTRPENDVEVLDFNQFGLKLFLWLSNKNAAHKVIRFFSNIYHNLEITCSLLHYQYTFQMLLRTSLWVYSFVR